MLPRTATTNGHKLSPDEADERINEWMAEQSRIGRRDRAVLWFWRGLVLLALLGNAWLSWEALTWARSAAQSNAHRTLDKDALDALMGKGDGR